MKTRVKIDLDRDVTKSQLAAILRDLADRLVQLHGGIGTMIIRDPRLDPATPPGIRDEIGSMTISHLGTLGEVLKKRQDA